MRCRHGFLLATLAWLLAGPLPPGLPAGHSADKADDSLTLQLRNRDPKSGVALDLAERVDPAKVGIVVIDMWNYHHCLTAGQRVGAMVPRMNRALECARKLGMTVIWAPTDAADAYVGTPQRERALAVPELPLPKVRSIPWCGTLGNGGCMCGPGIVCQQNYGWDGMNPGLKMAESDYLVGMDAPSMYSLCAKLGLTHLIYMGVHTNVCVLGKGPAIKNMYDTGLRCVIARDLTDALTHYDPQAGFTPDGATALVVSDLEKSDIPSLNMADQMQAAGLWKSEWITEPVRITPWGTDGFPYQFRDQPVLVTLSAPWLENVEFRYTLDGSEPTATSPLYSKPLALDSTTTLRTAAFRDGRCVSLPSRGFFAKLPPLPPKPDVPLDTLKPLNPKSGPTTWNWPLTIDKAQDGSPLAIRGKSYEKGLAGRAPCGIRYELKPEYDRFVALAGVDDELFRLRPNAMLIGRHAAVVFQVFIDGQLAAKSPVLRLTQEPWPFDVKIPEGSKQLHLVVTAAEDPSPYALGDWVQAGFVVK